MTTKYLRYIALSVILGALTLHAAPTLETGNTQGGQANKPPNPPAASKVHDTNRFSDSVLPGQTVTFTGEFVSPKADEKPVVKVHPEGSDAPPMEAKDAKLGDDKKTISVTLPDKLLPGRYFLTLTYAGLQDAVVPSELRVVSDVQLDSAHPTTAYRNGKGSFDFDIIGRNFSPNTKDDDISIAGQGSIIKTHAASKKDCDNATPEQLPCLWFEAPDKIHVVGYKGEPYQGPISFGAQVGSAQSAQKTLVLARLSPAGIRFWSILIFGVLAYIIYRLVAGGLRNSGVANDGQRYSPFASFFLDKETDTYSLSKFQLLLFSATFIFGYVYVFLCGWLVQWHFVLPDVPATFSGILGMSAGTTVIAAGATSARGSKGAGGIRPSFSDFITTGGQVVPERFQYFVWTLTACFGFVALLLSQDPATVSGFPDIPQGLLYVMGVSAGGYLAGKVTRAPGPVIRNIAWNNDQKLLVVQGENLSDQGDYFIDGKKLPIVTDDTRKLLASTPQEQASDRSFCSELRITISDQAGLDLSTGDHVFRIMNKDAQFADMRFTADPPSIDSVQTDPPPPQPFKAPDGTELKTAIAASGQNTPIKVVGTGFRTGIIARWTAVGAKEPVEITSVVVQDDKNLKLTLMPGGAGPATLLLLTPNGFSAVANVSVVTPATGAPTPDTPAPDKPPADAPAPDKPPADAPAPAKPPADAPTEKPLKAPEGEDQN